MLPSNLIVGTSYDRIIDLLNFLHNWSSYLLQVITYYPKF